MVIGIRKFIRKGEIDKAKELIIEHFPLLYKQSNEIQSSLGSIAFIALIKAK